MIKILDQIFSAVLLIIGIIYWTFAIYSIIGALFF
jgi:hypothetical protein